MWYVFLIFPLFFSCSPCEMCSRMNHSGEASEPTRAATQGLSAYFAIFVCIRIRWWCCINLAYSRPKEKLLQRLIFVLWPTLWCGLRGILRWKTTNFAGWGGDKSARCGCHILSKGKMSSLNLEAWKRLAFTSALPYKPEQVFCFGACWGQSSQ